jgi:hypothetical protein
MRDALQVLLGMGSSARHSFYNSWLVGSRGHMLEGGNFFSDLN